MTTRSFRHIIETFHRHEVEFAVVGGVAAVLHGAPVTTFDLDTLVLVSEDNARRLLAAFAELEARCRGHATIIRPERRDILAGGHLLLATNAGPLDVLGFIGRQDRFEDLRHEIACMDLAGLPVPVQGSGAYGATGRVRGRLVSRSRGTRKPSSQAAGRGGSAVWRRLMRGR